MKQTAVEWLGNELVKKGFPIEKYGMYLFEQAKEMEKQQIIDAWENGAYGGGQFTTIFDNSEEYYNETFKNK
jgi:hypothetical protein